MHTPMGYYTAGCGSGTPHGGMLASVVLRSEVDRLALAIIPDKYIQTLSSSL